MFRFLAATGCVDDTSENEEGGRRYETAIGTHDANGEERLPSLVRFRRRDLQIHGEHL